MRQTVVQAALAPSPETVWAAIAPRLAARGRMRVSRDGGRTYPKGREFTVSTKLPNQPAAVLAYDNTGCAPTIFLDLDAGRGDANTVERDYALLKRLFLRTGIRWFSDTSPNGGRHVYIPLARPVPFQEAKAFTNALAAAVPSLDPMPMNGIDSGCIRPPGARHRTGGHQSLDGSLSAAVNVLVDPNNEQAWDRLRIEVGAPKPSRHLPTVTPLRAEPLTATSASDEERLDGLLGYREPSETYAAIARSGEFDSAKYATASEARQAVIWAAVASGMSFGDLARRIADGTWKGLASFYARYPARHRNTAVVTDWRNAIAFEKNRRLKKASDLRVHESTTSPQQTHAGGQRAWAPSSNAEVRVWLAAVDLVSRDQDLAVKAVLYALAEAAALTGRLVVEHGNRSLAIATGLDQATVGKVLRRLSDAPPDRRLIDLVEPAKGPTAARYALVIPALLRPACEAKPWRRGKIHAVRPVFRVLGLAAAFVYAGLEQQREAISVRDLAPQIGMGTSTVHDAMLVLSAWGLATRVRDGWVLGPASTSNVGERLDVDALVAAQVAKYRAERRAWWLRLGLIQRVLQMDEADRRRTGENVLAFEAPGALEAAVALVEQVLGGRLLSGSSGR